MPNENTGDLAPPPEVVEFPVQLLEQWFALPPSERIAAQLTKQDVDNLVLGLLRNGDAIGKLDQTIVDWSNGDIGKANASLAESRRLNITALNHIRRFFIGLMIATLRERGRGG